MDTQTQKIFRPDLDAAIRHLESVRLVVLARRHVKIAGGARVIPFPPRNPKKAYP